MAHRRLERSIILQLLYDWSIWGEKEDFPLEREFFYLRDHFLHLEMSDSDGESIITRMKEIQKRISDIDLIISKASEASSWDIQDFPLVDKNIMRLSSYELIFDERKIGGRIILNEAVELAKKFGGRTSYKFVNGVLGAIYRELFKESDEEREKFAIPYEEMEIDRKVAGVIYSMDVDGNIKLCMVHDVFGYWTLPKGTVDESLGEEETLKGKIKEETNLDVEILEDLGESEYIAFPPDRGAVRKQVRYYLTKSEFRKPKLPKDPGGLDDVKWFPIEDVLELNLYNDVLKILTKAVEQIAMNESLTE